MARFVPAGRHLSPLGVSKPIIISPWVHGKVRACREEFVSLRSQQTNHHISMSSWLFQLIFELVAFSEHTLRIKEDNHIKWWPKSCGKSPIINYINIKNGGKWGYQLVGVQRLRLLDVGYLRMNSQGGPIHALSGFCEFLRPICAQNGPLQVDWGNN
jgi:hypothetical protein